MYHKIRPFKGYNSVVLVEPRSCAAGAHSNFRTFSSPRRKLRADQQSPSTTDLFSVSLDLPILATPQTQNYILCDLSSLASFT